MSKSMVSHLSPVQDMELAVPEVTLQDQRRLNSPDAQGDDDLKYVEIEKTLQCDFLLQYKKVNSRTNKSGLFMNLFFSDPSTES